MAEFGHYTMCLAWVLCLLGMGAGAFAGIRGSTAWFLTARSATILVAVSTCLVLFALGHAFYHSDFALQYVWQYSNRAMPPVYRIAAIWGGMDGSMLLWCGMLAISAGIVAWRSVSYPRALMPWVLVVLNSASCFFLTVTVFLTNPFRYLHAGYIPLDGRGLNPLLQNPLMAIHPPLLYLSLIHI